MNTFKHAGQGEAADSWVAPGPNKQIGRSELEQAIGPEVLETLSRQTGLSREEIVSRLSRNLPEAVDKYTPDGRIRKPNRPSSYGVISHAVTNAAAHAGRDLREIPSRIASPSTNGPRRSTPESRAAIGRVTSSFASAHGQCSFSMNANRA